MMPQQQGRVSVQESQNFQQLIYPVTYMVATYQILWQPISCANVPLSGTFTLLTVFAAAGCNAVTDLISSGALKWVPHLCLTVGS